MFTEFFTFYNVYHVNIFTIGSIIVKGTFSFVQTN